MEVRQATGPNGLKTQWLEFGDMVDLEEFDRILKTTRSIRRKLDFKREVPMSVIEECIDVAVQAPVGLGGENWRFIVVKDVAVKRELSNIYNEVLRDIVSEREIELKPTHRALMDRLHEIPCMILACVVGEPGENPGQQTAFYGSILPAVWSLMLALRARDIGATWTTLLSSRQAQVGQLLGIPGGVTQTVMLPVAYTKGAVLRVADRLPAKKVIYLDRWGEK